jgi:polar amino acid transport system substrate-binding protein
VIGGFWGCSAPQNSDKLIFATSAEYPPFEYIQHGQMMGFDVELAQGIAKYLGKKPQFKDMQFNTVLVAVQNGIADAAISTVTVTEERKKNFDFSVPYYKESLAVLFHTKNPIENQNALIGKKIICQLGTTMEIWLKKHAKNSEIITMDNNPQAVEMLKSGRVDGVLIDAVQAGAFAKNNASLGYKIIAQADTGYAIAFKKGSVWIDKINEAIHTLETTGEIEKLKKKYLENSE